MSWDFGIKELIPDFITSAGGVWDLVNDNGLLTLFVGLLLALIVMSVVWGNVSNPPQGG